MYINRLIEQTIKRYSNNFPVVALSGPLGVGKTTVLNHLKECNMKYVSLTDINVRNLAINDPKYFLEHYGTPLLIDEIQYAPNLLSYIKIIVDNDRLYNLKNNLPNKCLYWITGYDNLKLSNTNYEFLAGRIGVLNLYSLSLDEIDNKNLESFSPYLDDLKNKKININYNSSNIFQYIFNGGMPTVVTNKNNREEYFSSYINTYISIDIRESLNVGKTVEFYNFMQYLAVRTAQEVNYSNIAKEIGIDSKTVKKWISILETSGIIYLLQPYASNVTNRLIKSPKLYFMDTGLCSYLAKYPTPLTLEVGALSGAIFETFIVSEIIKKMSNYGQNPSFNLYYYRDKDQKEINLLYINGDDIIPIEIKKAISPNNPDKNFSVLTKFNKNIRAGLVICMTDKLKPINKDCSLVPVEYI